MPNGTGLCDRSRTAREQKRRRYKKGKSWFSRQRTPGDTPTKSVVVNAKRERLATTRARAAMVRNNVSQAARKSVIEMSTGSAGRLVTWRRGIYCREWQPYSKRK